MVDNRFTMGAKNSPLADVVLRALQETGGWSVKALRAPGFRMLESVMRDPEFRALAPLPEDAQKLIDQTVVGVGQQRLTFAADIMTAGLTYPISDPLSVTQLEWYNVNKVGAAQRTMSPSARGENKQRAMLPSRLPVYLTTDTFELDIRTLRMSERVGMPLDTALIEYCTRSVNEAIEDAAINGATTLDGEDLTVAGYSAPGLLNAPHAETQSLTAAAWTTAPVGSTVFNEVQAMKAKLVANKKYGPYRLYVGNVIGDALDSDYSSAKGDNTIKDRLLKIEGLEAVRVADMMPAGKAVLVQMTREVIDMVVGQTPTVIPWTSLDGFTVHNLVMAIMIPRVRSNYENESGICIGTTA
jgi:hypothetical protein